MSRVAWVLFFLSQGALAHPGHGAPESHFHQSPAIFLLAAVLASALWRMIPALTQVVCRKRTTRSQIAAP